MRCKNNNEILKKKEKTKKQNRQEERNKGTENRMDKHDIQQNDRFKLNCGR